MDNINVTIDTNEAQKQTSDVASLCKKGTILVIINQDQYEKAASVLTEIKSRYKELEKQRKEITVPLDNAKKQVMDLFREPLEQLKSAEDTIKRTMIGYTDEQERLAREEQKRLQELADKELERQKKLIEAKIERAKASGKEEKVETLEMEKEMIAPVVAPVVVPKIDTPKGVSYRDKYTAEVIDFKLLPDEYKLPNQSALDKVAQATKGTISIPGVKIKSEKILASR